MASRLITTSELKQFFEGRAGFTMKINSDNSIGGRKEHVTQHYQPKHELVSAIDIPMILKLRFSIIQLSSIVPFCNYMM